MKELLSLGNNHRNFFTALAILLVGALTVVHTGNVVAQVTTLAEDEASNYDQSDFVSQGNLGNGFGNWYTSNNNGGWFRGDAIVHGVNSAGINTDDNSFGMWAGNTGFVDVGRLFSESLGDKQTFSFTLAYRFDDGNRGFTLNNGGWTSGDEKFTFNVNSSGYTWAGGGAASITPWDNSEGDRQNGVAFQFTFTQNGSDLDYDFTSTAGGGPSGNGSITNVGIDRIKFYISNAGSGDGNNMYFNSLKITTPPIITLNPTSLSGFSYTAGNGPSAEQNFTIEGEYLNGAITLTAPTNYEISTTSGSGFGTSLTLAPASGEVANTIIYVRLKSGLTAGDYDETLTISTADIDNIDFPLNGTVISATTYSIGINSVEGGTATVTTSPADNAPDGSTVIINISDLAPTPKKIQSVTVTGVTIPSETISVTTVTENEQYTFVMPEQDVTIDVELYTPQITFYFRGPETMNASPAPEVWGPFTSESFTDHPFTFDSNLRWWTTTVDVLDENDVIIYQVRYDDDATKFQKTSDFGGNPSLQTATGEIWVDAIDISVLSFGGSGNNDFHVPANYITTSQPNFDISFVNLQFPATIILNKQPNIPFTPADVYARVRVNDGDKNLSGENGTTHTLNGLEAWIGYSKVEPTNTADFANAENWTWVPAEKNAFCECVDNSEYQVGIGAGFDVGVYFYVSRFRYKGGDFKYGGYNGGEWDGTTNTSGVLTVTGIQSAAAPPTVVKNKQFTVNVVNAISSQGLLNGTGFTTTVRSRSADIEVDGWGETPIFTSGTVEYTAGNASFPVTLPGFGEFDLLVTITIPAKSDEELEFEILDVRSEGFEASAGQVQYPQLPFTIEITNATDANANLLQGSYLVTAQSLSEPGYVGELELYNDVVTFTDGEADFDVILQGIGQHKVEVAVLIGSSLETAILPDIFVVDFSNMSVAAPGDQISNVAFNLTIQGATDVTGAALGGTRDVFITSTQQTEGGGIVFDGTADFSAGSATVNIALVNPNDDAEVNHTLVVSVDGVSEGFILTVRVVKNNASMSVTLLEGDESSNPAASLSKVADAAFSMRITGAKDQSQTDLAGGPYTIVISSNLQPNDDLTLVDVEFASGEASFTITPTKPNAANEVLLSTLKGDHTITVSIPSLGVSAKTADNTLAVSPGTLTNLFIEAGTQPQGNSGSIDQTPVTITPNMASNPIVVVIADQYGNRPATTSSVAEVWADVVFVDPIVNPDADLTGTGTTEVSALSTTDGEVSFTNLLLNTNGDFRIRFQDVSSLTLGSVDSEIFTMSSMVDESDFEIVDPGPKLFNQAFNLFIRNITDEFGSPVNNELRDITVIILDGSDIPTFSSPFSFVEQNIINGMLVVEIVAPDEFDDFASNGDLFTIQVNLEGVGIRTVDFRVYDADNSTLTFANPGQQLAGNPFNIGITAAQDVSGANLTGRDHLVTITAENTDTQEELVLFNKYIAFTGGVPDTAPSVVIDKPGTYDITVEIDWVIYKPAHTQQIAVIPGIDVRGPGNIPLGQDNPLAITPPLVAGYGVDDINARERTITLSRVGGQDITITDVTVVELANPDFVIVSLPVGFPATSVLLNDANPTFTFGVKPLTDDALANTTLSDVVRIDYDYDTSSSADITFGVSIEVVDRYEFTLIDILTGDFPVQPLSLGSPQEGYANTSHEKTFNLRNTGTGNLKNTSVTLTGANALSFEISSSDYTPDPLLPYEDPSYTSAHSFTVRPIIGLLAGTYNATVNVSMNAAAPGTGTITQQFDITFSVTASGLANTLDPPGPIFKGVYSVGYDPEVMESLITVANVGEDNVTNTTTITTWYDEVFNNGSADLDANTITVGSTTVVEGLRVYVQDSNETDTEKGKVYVASGEANQWVWTEVSIEHFDLVPATGWISTDISPGDNFTFTVRPKTGLSNGGYYVDTITVTPNRLGTAKKELIVRMIVDDMEWAYNVASNNWGTQVNWQPATLGAWPTGLLPRLPNEYVNIVIPKMALSNQNPAINTANRRTRSLTINPGGELTVQGSGLLTVLPTGTLTIQEDASETGGHLIVSNSLVNEGTITIESAATNKGRLTVTPTGRISSTAGAINNPVGNVNNFVIQSDADNRAGSVILNTTGVFATVQRWMLAQNFHLVSAPVIGQDKKDFFDAVDNNIAVSQTGNIAIRTFSEANNSYDPWVNTTNYASTWNNVEFEPGKAYAMATNSSGPVHFRGQLQPNAVNYAVTSGGGRWNLIGNPFPSALGMRDVVGGFLNPTNVGNLDAGFAAIYMYDFTRQPGNRYFIVNNVPSGFDYVALGQGFFVRVASGAQPLQFTRAMRDHRNESLFKDGEDDDMDLPVWWYFDVEASFGSKLAKTLVAFNDNMSTGLDVSYDAGMYVDDQNFNLFTRMPNGESTINLGIQALPDHGFEDMLIPLGLTHNAGGSVSFRATREELPSYLTPLLFDQNSQSYHDILANSYHTSVPQGASPLGRFYLKMQDSRIMHTVTFSAMDQGGTVNAFVGDETINSDVSMAEGTTITFVAEPLPGFETDTWFVNGIEAGFKGENTFIIKRLLAETNVEVTFTDSSKENENILDVTFVTDTDLLVYLSDNFIIIDGLIEEKGEITVTDLAGRTIISGRLEEGISNKVSMQGMPKGVYVVYISDQSGRSNTTRIVLP